MHWKTKQRIGYVAVTAVFCIIALVYLWKPGISVQNEQEIDGKLKRKIEKVLPASARITYIHLDGFGASRKYRYAIITYLLPDDDQSHTISLYVDGTGGSFDPVSRPADSRIAYGDGLLLSEMDFSVLAANSRRIRDRFVEEGKEWMGIAGYSIQYDPDTRDFVHEVKVYYETGPTWFKWAIDYLFNAVPSESETFVIRQNGTGALEII